MTEQKNNQEKKMETKKTEMNREVKPVATPKSEVKSETKVEEKKVEVKNKTEISKTEAKPAAVSPVIAKKEVAKIAKKEEAVAKGNNLHASMKQCMFICRFIKNKSIDQAISDLQEVIKIKKIVPMVGEIPHRKGNIMSGRYPVNASKLFIPILKSLKGNVLTNQMDLDKSIIYFASSSYASRPSKKGGGTFKRANIVLKAKEAAK